MSRKKTEARNVTPEPTDEYDRKLLADVEQHGWHVIGVRKIEKGLAFASAA
jgi:hypothetical protein